MSNDDLTPELEPDPDVPEPDPIHSHGAPPTGGTPAGTRPIHSHEGPDD